MTKDLLLEERLGTKLSLHPILIILLIFPSLLNSQFLIRSATHIQGLFYQKSSSTVLVGIIALFQIIIWQRFWQHPNYFIIVQVCNMFMEIKISYFVIFGEINFIKLLVLVTISKSKVCSEEREFAFPVSFLSSIVLKIFTFQIKVETKRQIRL